MAPEARADVRDTAQRPAPLQQGQQGEQPEEHAEPKLRLMR
jgi:hypothetical protein